MKDPESGPTERRKETDRWAETDKGDRYVTVLLSRGGKAAPLLPHVEKILHHLKRCKDKKAGRGFYKGTKQRDAVKDRHSIPPATLADLVWKWLDARMHKKKKKREKKS